jgi:hypothetical protein
MNFLPQQDFLFYWRILVYTTNMQKDEFNMFTGRKYSKLWLAAGLLLTTLLLCISPALAVSGMSTNGEADKPFFSDLADTSPLYPYVRYLTSQGIISGFPDGTFRPSEGVTRAQAAKVIVLAKGMQPVNNATPIFSDVPANHWAAEDIKAAADAGIVKGSDGAFRPDAQMTRAEAVVMIMRALRWMLAEIARIVKAS